MPSLRRVLVPALVLLVLAVVITRDGREARGAALPPKAAPAKITMASSAGSVQVAAAGTEAWKPAAKDMELNPEDQVQTGADGYAMVAYDDATLRILPGSLAVLGHASIRVRQGTTWMRMRKSGRTFSVETPSIAVSVVGTLVRAEAGRTESKAQLFEGAVNVNLTRDPKQIVSLTPGFQAIAPNGGGLTRSRIDIAALARLSTEYANVTKILPSKDAGKQGDKGKKSGSGSGGGDAGDAGGAGGLNALPGFGPDADSGTGSSTGGGATGGGSSGGGGTSGPGGTSAPAAGPGASSSSATPGKSGQGSTPSGGAATPGPRAALSGLQDIMDTRSTGLISSTFGSNAELVLPNSGSGTTQVQSQPGGAASRAAPALLVAPTVPGTVQGPGGGAPPPPPPQ